MTPAKLVVWGLCIIWLTVCLIWAVGGFIVMLAYPPYTVGLLATESLGNFGPLVGSVALYFVGRWAHKR